MIITLVSSSLSHLSGCDNKYDGEDNNKPDQSYSINSDKKMCIKIILKKSKGG